MIRSNRHKFVTVFVGMSIIYLGNGECDIRWEREFSAHLLDKFVKAVAVYWSIVGAFYTDAFW